MKKVVLSVLVSLVAVFALPLTAYASANVDGYVNDNNGNGVNGASVYATCTDSGNTATGSATSATVNGKAGGYYIQLSPTGTCKAGDTVTVTATKGSTSGTASGTFTNLGADVNIALVSVTIGLPEMGLATGVFAAIAAGGAFLVIRRRNLAKE